MSGRVPPSSRASRKPAGPASKNARADVRRAAALYERFTGHAAESLGSIDVLPMPSVGVVIGDIDGVLYTTVRDGKREHYKHDFAASDKPLFVVSPDGRQLMLIGGRYRFTARGIVDTSDKSR